MYCMGCNKHLEDDNPDMFMFKFDNNPEAIVAHACNPSDLTPEKYDQWVQFGQKPETAPFVINGKKYFGMVIED